MSNLGSDFLQMTVFHIDRNHIQQNLDSLQKRTEDCGMSVNSPNCYIMSIHRDKDPSSVRYSLDNHIWEQVQNNLYLGVIISENLK